MAKYTVFHRLTAGMHLVLVHPPTARSRIRVYGPSFRSDAVRLKDLTARWN